MRKVGFILSLVFLFVNYGFSQVTDVITATGNGTWVCPAGVTSATITVWGAGAGGGGCNSTADGGGGGGGGGCSQSTIAVSAGTYNLFVGAGGPGGIGQNDGTDGEQTWFLNATTVQANGGIGGLQRDADGGQGGNGAAAGIGGVFARTGGNGANGRNNNTGRGGGGGGGAGTTGNGLNASANVTTYSLTGGGARAVDGGSGGDGGNQANGANGATFGGGGGGAGEGTNRRGGRGANGKIEITYSLPAPGNDEACSPTAIVPGGACLTSQTNAGATSFWFGGCIPVGSPEVWYTTTLTGTNNTLNINLSNSTFPGDVSIQVNTKNDVCPADNDMSNFGTYCGPAAGPISFPGLNPGVQYHIGISSASGTSGSFDICVTESVTFAFPDDPCDAVLIADDYCSAGLVHTNVGAVSSFAGGFFNTFACGDNNQNEVWFRFTATENSLDIVVTQGTIGGAQAEVSILETAPDPNDCNDLYSFVDFSCGAWGSTLSMVNSLVPGQVYYIAVDHQGGNGLEGTFDICLTPYTYSPPVGSGFTCGTAIDINANGLPFQDISTTTGAGNNWDEACDYFYQDLGLGGAAADLVYPGWTTEDKFYSLTVPAGGGFYEYSLSVLNGSLVNSFPAVSVVSSCPAFTDNDWNHTSGLCVGQTDKDGTDDQNSWASDMGVFEDMECRGIYLPAGNYYFIVDNAAVICPDGGGCALYDNQSYDYQFDVNVLSAAPNNECGGAVGLFDGVTQNGNNAGCNYSYGPNDPFSSEFCAFSTENLAWFTFTTGPAATSVTLDFTNISGSIQWGIFSGACGGPYTSAGANAANTGQGFSSAGDPCDATSGPTYNTTVTGLTANTQYWFGVDGNAGAPSTFDVTVTGVTTLPVDLSTFNVVNKNTYIEIEWMTLSEKNNDYFLIERSFDGVNYEIIGNVKGAGNSSIELKYSMRDFDIAQKGLRYYRLKQVDFNGAFKYYDPKTIKFEDYTIPKIYPNPFFTELSVAFSVQTENENVKISIVDSKGAFMLSDTFETTKGSNNLTIDTDKYPSGIYFIMVDKGGVVTKQKFLKK